MVAKEYIEREALKRDLIDNRSFYPAIVKNAIESAPAVDAIEVVRCKDCEHYGLYGVCKLHSETADQYSAGVEVKMKSDDYCSYGERKKNDEL